MDYAIMSWQQQLCCCGPFFQQWKLMTSGTKAKAAVIGGKCVQKKKGNCSSIVFKTQELHEPHSYCTVFNRLQPVVFSFSANPRAKIAE